MPKINTLYPIFLKVDQLQVLVVGGGNVAFEKLTFLFKSSPQAQVTLVAPKLTSETANFTAQKSVKVILKKYHCRYLKEKHIVIAATEILLINHKVQQDCKQRGILVNVADTPTLCDFYMGGIVTKGNLKIAISTNGKSPTMAKRLRQWLEIVIPDKIDNLLDNLHCYRESLKKDFYIKVKQMNRMTKSFLK